RALAVLTTISRFICEEHKGEYQCSLYQADLCVNSFLKAIMLYH
ncbi:MAG: hypothetical protein ACI89S_002806, partial [Gammaproteobacteria bacterium]